MRLSYHFPPNIPIPGKVGKSLGCPSWDMPKLGSGVHDAGMTTDAAKRLKELRESRKLSRRALAELVNCGESQIVKLERGDRRLTLDWVNRLARALDVPASDFLTDDAAPPPNPRDLPGVAPFEPIPVPSPAQLKGGLPVYGVAACHNAHGHQAFEMQGQIVDRVKYPPALVNVPGAYALYAVGDSMEPRYYEGELVYVHPGKPPVPGSFVVVQFKPDHEGGNVCAMIKRLVRRSPSKVRLAQFNPDDEFDVPMEEVHVIHRILNGEELF